MPEKTDIKKELLVLAWGLIANVGNGDWTTQTEDWQKAATEWRDRWYKIMIDSE
jgi:hypothetical protein